VVRLLGELGDQRDLGAVVEELSRFETILTKHWSADCQKNVVAGEAW
jgi:hypothetical protein